ncbi:SCP-2 sterol transfer family protein [Pseudovibrio sp. W64]|uniref:SCP2 sterol-binding domain-containing protein n=1 Tax=unclassified Pseudovibrio TaxID=2627060 RepID=UPI00070DC062|nr:MULTISPECIES: SCP2 sterol-binding domain-containing protein [unclassified Pseudovibrio]KZK75889.1 SCP-2 sterol transfer family protein [Pseudovibrio sp. Ad13]KZK87729.1 SCP-2 sterol transfer family protein [Pseudovibrio sp. W64]KZK88487.1 SCP-2 sterol transfer family protein [Pseudovibrio sp. Ad46]KZK90953.1 SCP-2 sterol transfer family protein [Pseudovibrio sp. Ad5]KZL03681.1 SCP-2 sterol transfer family protein [Pseudovibrio sp. W74]
MSEFIQKIVTGINGKLDGVDMSKSIALNIKDEGFIIVDENGARAEEAEADCTISCSAKTFKGLVDGSVNPMTAVMMGKIKIGGDKMVAMSLGKILG